MIRIVIADDHRMIREGITSILADNKNVQVVSYAATGEKALAKVKKHKPDLLVTDISMAGMNGLEVAEKVIMEFPDTKVLVLSIYDNEDYVVKSIDIGCSGYLMKSAEPSEINEAINTIYKGGKYYGKSISQTMMQNFSKKPSVNKSEGQASITKREKEIINLICDGKTTKEISELLFISISTVNTHRTNLFVKLKVSNVAQLIRCSLKNGLVTM